MNPPMKDPLTEFSVMVEEGKIKMVEWGKKRRERDFHGLTAEPCN